MIGKSTDQRMGSLKAVKSAFILEAQSLMWRGLAPFARPFYQEAAQAEIELAELFRSQGRELDAKTSLMSAASCLFQAGQYQQAAPILDPLAEDFPEARRMLEESRGRADEPLVADSPELRALIALLVRKGLFTEDEWAQALEAATSH